MHTAIDRDPSGGFSIKDDAGTPIDHRPYFHQARIRAMSIANDIGDCIIVSRVDDDVPATQHAKTRGLG